MFICLFVKLLLFISDVLQSKMRGSQMDFVQPAQSSKG